MTLPAFASVADLKARLGGSFGSGDELRAQKLLDDASTLIRLEAGVDWVDTTDPTTLATDLPPAIPVVCLASARRAYENDDNVQSESLGHASFTYFPASNDVYLTRAERRIICKAGGQAALSSIQLESPYVARTGAVIYAAVEGGGDDVGYFTDLGPDTIYGNGENIL